MKKEVFVFMESQLKLFLYLVFISLIMNSHAQDLRVYKNKKGKIGYVDSLGNQVIKCKYESAQPFKDGVAIVSKSGKYGIIKSSGEVALPLKYTSITSWSDSVYLIKNKMKMGLVDKKGNLLLEAKYSHISSPNCYGKALISLGGVATTTNKKTYMLNAKHGLVDSKGNILIQPVHKGLYEFSCNVSNVFPYYEGMKLDYTYHFTTDTLVTDCSYLGYSKNAQTIYSSGIIDINGNIIVESERYDLVMYPQNGMVKYYKFKKDDVRCGFYNLEPGAEQQDGPVLTNAEKNRLLLELTESNLLYNMHSVVIISENEWNY